MAISKPKVSAKPKTAAKKVQKTIKKTDSKAGVVSKDFSVDEESRYTGACVYFNKSGGYGFVKLDDAGILPDDKVMIYWKDIQTEDRWPSLHKGFKCEFGLKKFNKGKECSVKAVELTAVGGASVNIQDDAEEKFEFVGDKGMRFLGNVKFYDFDKGFGYVKLQDGYDIDSSIPTELRVSRTEVNAGNDAPRLSNEMEIEFGIMKTKKGVYCCYNVTLPGGDAVARNIVEGREEVDKTTCTGKVLFWNKFKGFGYIEPETAKLSQKVKTLLKADAEKRAAKATKKGKTAPEGQSLYFRRGDLVRADGESVFVKGGAKCTFKIYKDNQGVGACEVKLA